MLQGPKKKKSFDVGPSPTMKDRMTAGGSVSELDMARKKGMTNGGDTKIEAAPPMTIGSKPTGSAIDPSERIAHARAVVDRKKAEMNTARPRAGIQLAQRMAAKRKPGSGGMGLLSGMRRGILGR